jgi:hypothetical protein
LLQPVFWMRLDVEFVDEPAGDREHEEGEE